MPRGGRRAGAPGATYQNRTDLNREHMPITRIPGQEYGQQAAQVRAQQSVPVGPTPAPTPLGPLPMQGAVGSPPTGTPTEPIPLTAPTMRPNEPVTAGAALGPGPGPAPAPLSAASGIGATLSTLATQSNSPELALLADYVASGRA